ncbi:MAG: hypothetical protein NC084_04590 [Bacteroides sp.]|nr:hypothetical protein [Bacteroides sp.]
MRENVGKCDNKAFFFIRFFRKIRVIPKKSASKTAFFNPRKKSEDFIFEKIPLIRIKNKRLLFLSNRVGKAFWENFPAAILLGTNFRLVKTPQKFFEGTQNPSFKPKFHPPAK